MKLQKRFFIGAAVSTLAVLLNTPLAFAATPGGVTNPTLWLRADQGATASTWTDQSTNANNATQATAVNQPVPTDNAANNINFNPVMLFDGSSDFMNLNIAKMPTGTTARSFACVAQYDADPNATSQGHYILGWGSDNAASQAQGVASVSSDLYYAGGGNDVIETNFWRQTKPAYVMGTWAGSGGAANLYADSALVGGPTNKSWNTGTEGARVGFLPWGTTQYWDGPISECLLFTRVLSGTERQQLNTYLSIKYGFTTDQTTATNYLASDGSTVWDATANSGYKNRITVVGRDDESALTQKQSKSVETGSLITVGNGDTVAATNNANSSSFGADKSFLAIGDDNGSAGATTIVSGTADTRIGRTWKAQETGTVGSVRISIPASNLPGSAPVLFRSADATFDNTDTQVPLTVNGANYEATIDLSNGDYFTFASLRQAPGGVSDNLNLWVKADSGVATSGSNVTAWQDQYGPNTTFAATGTAPTYPGASNINFNPVVSFGGAGKLVGDTSITMAEAFSVNLWNGAINTERGTVVSPTTNTGGGTSQYFLRSASDSTLYTGVNPPNYVTTTPPPAGEVNLWDSGGTNIFRKNGLSVVSGTTGASMTGIPQVGDRSSNDSKMKGDIAEVLVYGTNPTSTERSQIQSYLAMKYGITLDQTAATNYLASDSSTVWDAATNAAYKSRITAIGRDDLSGLTQKQSKSIASGGLVTIGNGNTIATDNASNGSTFSADKSFLTFGDDNGVTTPTTLMPGTIDTRIGRTWKAQETGTVGSVKIQIPASTLSGATPELVRSADATFTSSDTQVPMTVNGANYEATIDLNNGDFFTFASFIPSPGGVSGESLWTRADLGTSTTTNGAAVSAWNDQSLQANDASQATGANQPLYEDNITDNINFNSVLKFDGSSDFFSLDQSKLPLGTSARTVLGIGKPAVLGSTNKILIGWGPFTTSQGFAVGSNVNGAGMIDGVSDNTATANNFWQVATVGEITASWAGSGGASNIYGKTKLAIGPVNQGWNTGATGGAKIGNTTFSGAGNQFWNGTMGDIIVYPRALSATERQQVDSYMAVKYGFNIDQTSATNYLASDGTTVTWDAAANATYKNRITGIGRDDLTALTQKQSKSTETGSLVTIGNGNTIAATNSANGSTFSADRSYLLFGDDNGALTWSAGGSTNYPSRLTRIFKAATTGTVGSVKVQAPDNSSSLSTKLATEGTSMAILVDADGDFSSGATEIPMTLNGTNWEADTAAIGSNYFTFATTNTPPDMTAATDSGNSNTDNLTNDNTPTFTGACNTGETMTLVVDGTPIAPTQVCASGAYTITPSSAIADGAHNITSSSSTGIISTPLSFTIDTVAPAALAAPDMTAATDSGISNADDTTGDATPDFTGSCTTGDTIRLFADGTQVGQQICAGSAYTITATTLTDGAHAMTVTATDPAGNTSAASSALNVTIDTAAPTALVAPDLTAATDTGTSNTDNLTNDATPDFTGSCVTGDVITLFADGTQVGQTTCASSAYTITAATLSDGVRAMTATATDLAGNVSAQSPVLNVTIDTSAPTALAAPDMTAATDTGASDSDNLTNDNTPNFTGSCVSGNTITLYAGGTQVGQVICASGAYTITPTTLTDGAHAMTVATTDPSGNISGQSSALNITVDTSAPAALVTPDMTSATDTGTSSTDNITNDATPDFTGSCTNGETVTFLIDGAIISQQQCAGGTYTVTPGSVITDGNYAATVTATDAAGNTSAVSPALTFTVDTSAPATPAITSPASGSTTNDTTPTITGTGENGATVTVTDQSNNTICTAVVAGGTWNCTAGSVLADGSYTLKAVQTDIAGNASSPSGNVTLMVDTGTPAAPIIFSPADGSSTNDTTPTITGTGEANATLHLVIDGGAPFNVPVDAFGNWTFTPGSALSNSSHTLAATQTDSASNTSPSSATTTFTVDTSTLDVTVNQKSGQSDPTEANSIFFTVVFNKPINTSTFGVGDITLGTSPSSPGAYIATFTQLDATTWEFEVKGMANGTTVSADIAANAAKDLAGNDNTASTSTDNSVLYQVPPPNVTPKVTNDTTPTIIGQCAAGHSLQLDLAGPATHTYNTTCDGTGNWSFDVTDVLPAGTYDITVNDTTGSVTNPVANQTGALVVDTTVPTVTVNQKSGQPDPTNVNSAAFTIVFSEVMNASTLVASDFTVAGTTGTVTSLVQLTTTTWEVTITGMTSGDTAVLSLDAGKAADIAGNTNTASTSTDNQVTFDNTVPTAPAIASPANGATVNDNTPTINGTGENGAALQVKVDGSTVACAEDPIVITGGAWVCTPTSVLTDGSHTVTAFQVDAAGNTSPDATNVTFTVDTTAPAALAAPDMTAATDTGSSNTDNTTNDATPDFSGSCTNGETVTLYVDGTQAGQQACTANTYTITASPAIAAGSHSVTVTATDPTGNTSPVSPALNITIDTTPPATPAAPDMTSATDSGTSNTDNITSDATPSFTGSCTTGNTMTLYVDGTPSGMQLCPAGGTYTITPASNMTNGTHAVTIIATDPSGNASASSASLKITIDTTAPLAPVITSPANNAVTNDATPVITGTGENGAIINVLVDGGPVVCVEDPVIVSGGTWTCTTPVLTEGPHAITATQTDVAGNVSAPSAATNITVDTTPPATPAAPDMTSATDTGSSNTDNVTNDATPDFTGSCTAGDTIKLFAGATQVGSATCSAGAYTLTVSPALTNGTHSMTITATDAANNISTSPALNITVDVSTPTAPATPDMTAATDSGVSNADNHTSDNTPDFTGACTASETVGLYINGTLTDQTVCPVGGTYTITPSTIADGAHTATVTATDSAGNISTQSPALNFVIDTVTDPAPVVTSPASGSTTTDATPTFVGTGQPGGTVTLTDGSTTICTATVAPDGSWSCTPSSSLANGMYNFAVSGTDQAGNPTASSPYTLTIDTFAGTPPVITSPTDGQELTDVTPAFAGTGKPGATVVVRDEFGNQLCTTTVDGSGNWSCDSTLSMSEGRHTITASQTDSSGTTLSGSPMTIIIAVDTDGVSAAVEDGAPNNGDGNGDGIKDSEQGAVTSIPDSATGGYSTLAVGGDECTTVSRFEVNAEDALAAQDAPFEYPVGLRGFDVRCTNPGGTVKVTLFLNAVYDTSAWQYRKFDDTLDTYSDMSSVIRYGSMTIGSNQVTTISYDALDGGVLDEDGAADGIYRDPSGPATVVSSGSLSSTGWSVAPLMVTGAFLIVVGMWLAQRYVKRIV